MIVVDNAMIVYLLIPGEYTAQADMVRAKDPDWIAPPLWLSEFRNVLKKYIVGGQLSLGQSLAHAEAAELLMRDRSYSVSSAEVLALVAASGCSAYDCEYAALARAAGLKLVTTNKELLRKFPDTAVHPDKF